MALIVKAVSSLLYGVYVKFLIITLWNTIM
jgi:hypothetical protein